MPLSIWLIPNLTDALEQLKDYRLAEDPRTYVYDDSAMFAWVTLLSNGYRFDFNKSYIRVVPE